ncbi:MAG: hypothetical protein ACTSU2_04060 [Promethearchaeota archaeon]
MAKPLPIIGGIIVLIGTIGALFISELAWYNWEVPAFMGWLNPFGGGGGYIFGIDLGVDKISDEFIDLVPGLLALAGGVLLITQNKTLSIIGFILVLLGAGMFLYALLQDPNVKNLLSTYDANGFWWSEEILGHKYYIRVGYGLIGSVVGALLGVLGCGNKD